VKRALIALCSMLLSAQVFAGNGGSAYTMFGIGDLVYFPSTRSAGMGYTGIGLPSQGYINALAPAAWSRINRVRVDANAVYEGINTSDATAKLYQARGLFNGVHFAIPISPASGIVFVAGVSPFSRIAYNTSTIGTQGGVDYRLNNIGSGSLTRGQVGLSYAPLEDLALGVSLSYLFGKTSTQRTLIPLSSGLSGATVFAERENRGTNVTFSTIFTGLGRVSEALRPLSLGFVLTTRTHLSYDLAERVEFIAEADTIQTAEQELTIPIAFGFGAAYQLADRWLFAADYYAQAWSEARANGLPLTNIRNSNRFGVGVEKVPLKDASSWWDKLAYRLGFVYEATYYRVNGEPINMWAATGGVTLPVSGETRFNIGIEYGQRGIQQTALVKDRIIRLSFSLSIAEPWFIRYEEE
jgi:hypothetical protein